MANMHKHPVRGLRGIDDTLWTDFDSATKAAGSDRSATLKAYMEWYVRREGAAPPERPRVK
ncbi:hypothetical protein ABZ154_13770 [Streptomyces sp. NPDC006261]|uniref:hypothetical protein n=1 Tax=Streptomyces sp. NPDC006261 TaxID=3156739 RepID=UPI0033A69CEA